MRSVQIGHLGRNDAVEEYLCDRIPMPNVPPDEEISDVVPTDEEVDGIRAYSRKFEYASRQHANFELIAEVGLRMGAVRAIDLDDFDADRRIVFLHPPKARTNTERH